jgi:serine/threonine protein kinase
MGTVYRATDLALEKTVALKVIAPHLASDPKFARRFREEAKALARLDAPGIVGVIALRETDAATALVMEHVDGPSLHTLLQRRGALDLAAALPLLHQVAMAIRHAHESGVLHRDLKPSNILIAPDGQAKITDFGLAKIQGSDARLTSTRERAGTVAYMSPEQVEGLRHVDARSDLFSFGLIAYEVLTGQLPYDVSGSPFAIQQALVEADFPAPSTAAAHVPPALDALVGRLLARDPADRPADAATVAAEMEAVASSVSAPATPDLTTSAPPDPPSRPLWGGLAATVLLALVGIYFGVQSALDPSPSPSRASSAASTPPDTLSVTTSPGGATVIVDGAPAGETPVALPVRGGGAVQVQLRKDGYVPHDTVLQVTGTARLAATLTPSAAGPSSATGSTDAPSSRAPPDPSPPGAAGRGSPSSPSTGRASVPRAARVLRIRTTPPGAAVRLDGAKVGTSPLALSDVSPGTYRLDVQKDGYQAVERTLTVPPRGSTVVQETLSPAPAVVELRVRPSGTIAVDGAVRRRDSDRWFVDTLAAGTYDLRLTSSLGRWTSTVTLEPGQTYRRTLDFSQTVDLAVTARTESGAPVPNATVYVDGTRVGYTPQRLSLRVGQHALRVEKDRFRAAERVLLVEPGMQSPVVVELVPRAQ